MRSISRRAALSRLAGAATLVASSGAVHAQAFPNHSIKVVIGYAAGGPLDTVARIIAQGMAEALGQPAFVENRTGASGVIASDYVKHEAPDGYTILFAPSTYVVNPILMDKVTYDPVKDFTPITHLATLAEVMITAQDSPINSVKDLIAMAKAHPGEVSYASTGVGGPAHLSSELFQHQTGTQTIHVPFKGSAPAVSEVMAGRVTYMFHPTTGLKELVEGRRVKPLAIAGSAVRLADYPDTPTMAEAGFPGYEDVGVWFGMLAPAKTPAPIIAKLNGAVLTALKKPATLERLKAVGAVPTGGTPAEFEDFIKRDVARWTTIIRAAKITLPNGS
jgi:tripartite-type tricarboxylate transporter receptor subunit TctC